MASDPAERVSENGDQQPPAGPRRTASYNVDEGTLDHQQDGLSSHTKVRDDGRVDITITQTNIDIAKQLEQIRLTNIHEEPTTPQGPPPPFLDDTGRPFRPPPPLNIVIQVVGSRGDVQPFVALGQVLKNEYGHRIRLATHGTFKKFVEENGLEFFNIGGDPAELMAFMVKNPGLIPGVKSLREGDVGKRQKGMAEILEGCWRSCADSDEVPNDESEEPNGRRAKRKPFVAHAIIANPPSFAHIHCAQKLGIPLHLMFTMPWSPTREFPQPIANIHTSNNARGQLTNEMSYTLVDIMTWEGLGDITNRFRKETLGLSLISQAAATDMLWRLRVPYTYCWSPALIPKPKDWGPNITISGFYFLSLATNYRPDPDLAEFLAAGPPPVYIGFGSIVVDDPNGMTKLIFEAVKKTGQRALVSKGWGGLGAEDLDLPEGVFMLGNCPHDWLFQHVSCVVHHGGAGTTAAGIALGRPTVIVPFFGDQPFWGAMVARAGAGPTPIPFKELTADKLAEAINTALKPSSLERARELGDGIKEEKGTEVGAASFHQHMNIDRMRCTVAPNRPAVWWVRTKGQPASGIRLSTFAATVLSNEGLLDVNQLRLYRPCEYAVELGQISGPSRGPNPVLSTAGAFAHDLVHLPINIAKAWAGVVYEPYKGARKGGWKGFGKGLGRGIGHFFIRERALTFGSKQFGVRALYDNIRRQLGDDKLSFILAVHFAQGFEQVKNSSEGERMDVLARWHELGPNLELVSTQSSRATAPDISRLTSSSSIPSTPS
ncbi:hypothetical protein PV11_10124 [Exophiala sideris]|uniref:Uncharacterized protein n=1 Tax=Exophiala sideris TaxID=1016849 RepID=A0A0D1Y6A0_9EURO|nr:hypothetical protein PV11_10124 [Exophiala sideris]